MARSVRRVRVPALVELARKRLRALLDSN